jgi:hypothetical protein
MSMTSYLLPFFGEALPALLARGLEALLMALPLPADPAAGDSVAFFAFFGKDLRDFAFFTTTFLGDAVFSYSALANFDKASISAFNFAALA